MGTYYFFLFLYIYFLCFLYFILCLPTPQQILLLYTFYNNNVYFVKEILYRFVREILQG